MRGISKVFPGVRALDDVSLAVMAGEVHVLLGQNGAGKSTLIKALYGAYHPDRGEFRFEGRPVAPLKVLDDADRVLFVGTFSKVMFPAVRLGYVVVPPALVRPFARLKALADGGTPLLEQDALAAFIASGGFERHLRRARIRHAERRAALLDALGRELGDTVEVVGTNAGLHLYLRLRGWSVARAYALAQRAYAAGVGVYPATPYYATPPREAGLVLGYGGLEPDEIRAGIATLGRLVMR